MKNLLRVCLTFLATVALCVKADGNPFEQSMSGSSEFVQLAQQSSTKVYKYRNQQGVTSFSDRAPANRRYHVVEVKTWCFACNPSSTVDWHNTPLFLNSFQGSISDAATRFSVDPALVHAVIHAESAFKADAISRAGAQGLMQLMPGTARDMGVADPFSPDENILGGVRYLASLMEKTGGNVTLATAAYNAGPEAVKRHQGIPPYEETKTYVRRVGILHDRYRRALANRS